MLDIQQLLKSENLPDIERENVLTEIDKLEDDAIINYNALLEKAKAADDAELVALITEITDDERKHVGNLAQAKADLLPKVAEKELEGEAEYTDEIKQSDVEELEVELTEETESMAPLAYRHPATEELKTGALAPVEDLEVTDVHGIANVEFEPQGNHYHVMFCDPEFHIDAIAADITPDGAVLNPPYLTDYCKDFCKSDVFSNTLKSPEFEKLLNRVVDHITSKSLAEV